MMFTELGHGNLLTFGGLEPPRIIVEYVVVGVVNGQDTRLVEERIKLATRPVLTGVHNPVVAYFLYHST
jgi:hypothetical protein